MKNGRIKDRKRKQQIADFSKLNPKSKCTPTDVDGFLEIDGRIFGFDLKYVKKHSDFDLETGIQYGQRRAFENLFGGAGVVMPTMFVIATHKTPIKKDVKAHKAIVQAIYYKGKWSIDGKKTLKEVMFKFFGKCDLKSPLEDLVTRSGQYLWT